jgi:hypothetical protein
MAIKQSADELIAFLNELVKIDAKAITELISQRVDCNTPMADHPSVQVGFGRNGGQAQCVVGMLGIINGFIGTIDTGKYQGWGCVAARYGEDGIITKFINLTNK